MAKISQTLFTTRRLCGAHVCQLPQFCVGHTIFCKMQKKYSSTSSSLFSGLLLEERERDLAFASRCLFSNSFSSLSILRQACFRRCRRAPFPFVMSDLVSTSTPAFSDVVSIGCATPSSASHPLSLPAPALCGGLAWMLGTACRWRRRGTWHP